MIKVEGEAHLKSDSTGEVFTVDADELDLEAAGSDERGMGAELLYVAKVEFTAKDEKPVTCEWTVSEYPVGVLNHVTHHAENGKLLKDFDFSYEHEPDE